MMPTSISKYTRIFIRFFVAYIIAMPLNNSYEIIAMMRGTLVAQDDMSAWALALTPEYIKALKDLFFVGALILLIMAWLKSSRVRRLFSRAPFPLVNSIVGLILLVSLYSFTFMPLTVVLMGIRGYWSLGFVYIGAAFHRVDKRRVYLALLGVFSVHFLMQIAEAVTDAGFAVYYEHRSPGIFIVPATAGIFALLIYAVGIDMRSNIVKILAFISLLLSNSSSGRLALIIYYAYTYRNKVKPKTLFYPIYGALLSVAGLFVVRNLADITGRGGASESALTRVGLIVLALSNWSSLIFGNGMGIATSQAVIRQIPNAVIADNTYLGMTYNAGFLPAALLLFFILVSFRYYTNKLLFFTIFVYSMTTVIFEINPVVQILLLFLGFDIGRRYDTLAREREAMLSSISPSLDLPGPRVA